MGSVLQVPKQNAPLFDRRPGEDPLADRLLGKTYWDFLSGLGKVVNQSAGAIRFGTHEGRLELPPGTTPNGGLFAETDTGQIYQMRSGAWVSLDLVLGYAALVTIGALTMVTADGTIGESQVLDDGTTVAIGTATPWAGAKLQVHTGTDENFAVSGPLSLATGVTLHSFDDAVAANEGMELRASEFLQNVGIDQNLHLSGPATLPDGVSLKSTDDTQAVDQSLEFVASGFAFEGGNVGIGLGAPAAYAVDVAGDVNVTGDFLVNGVPIGGAVAADVNLSGQNANIGTTNLRPGGVLAPVGLYLLVGYLRVTTAGAAGTLTLTVSWNDGAAISTAPGVNAAATTPPLFFAFSIYTAGAADITYAVSGITAGCVYMLKLHLVQQF